jgi:hypothetical protein
LALVGGGGPVNLVLLAIIFQHRHGNSTGRKMIHVQLINREGANLQPLIRRAIAEGQITSFETAKGVGGLRISHKKHPGFINIEQSKGPLLATITCTNPEKEWQLLEAFVGRVAYHFSNEVASINIQLEPRN